MVNGEPILGCENVYFSDWEKEKNDKIIKYNKNKNFILSEFHKVLITIYGQNLLKVQNSQ